MQRIPWLTSSQWAITSIILLGVWKNLGFNFILLVAGLQNIPRHLYEAAEIDGAGRWASFRYITVPSLTPVLFFVVVWGLINAFQIFDSPFILTTGGPGDASRTVVMYIYESGFRFFRDGLRLDGRLVPLSHRRPAHLTPVPAEPDLGVLPISHGRPPRSPASFRLPASTAPCSIGPSSRCCSLAVAVMLVPFVWMFSTSWRLAKDSFSLPPQWLPTMWRIENYQEVLDRAFPSWNSC